MWIYIVSWTLVVILLSLPADDKHRNCAIEIKHNLDGLGWTSLYNWDDWWDDDGIENWITPDGRHTRMVSGSCDECRDYLVKKYRLMETTSENYAILRSRKDKHYRTRQDWRIYRNGDMLKVTAGNPFNKR